MSQRALSNRVPSGIAAATAASNVRVIPVDSAKRIPALDGLRAISILLVLLGHSAGTAGFPHVELERVVGDYANLGVLVFFVISGYLITGLLMEEQHKHAGISLRLFYARRFLRLAPAFLTYLAFLLILMLAGWVKLSGMDLASAFTYTVNFRKHSGWYIGHLWSLSVEEQFYLLWPAVLAFLGRRNAGRVALAVVALSPVSRLAAAYAGWPGSIFPSVADSLACGCLLALWGKRLVERPAYWRALRSSFLLPAAAILILVSNWTRSYLIGMTLGVTVINLLIAVVVHRCMLVQSLLTRLLCNRLAVGIGVLSYSLYIWQQFFLNRHSTRAITTFPYNLGLTVLFACLSYAVVEKPFNRFRKALRRG